MCGKRGTGTVNYNLPGGFGVMKYSPGKLGGPPLKMFEINSFLNVF